jgi:hypothetical protein
MVSGLRHEEDYIGKELWIISSLWCGKLGVLVDWRRAHISVVCCVAYLQPFG